MRCNWHSFIISSYCREDNRDLKVQIAGCASHSVFANAVCYATFTLLSLFEIASFIRAVEFCGGNGTSGSLVLRLSRYCTLQGCFPALEHTRTACKQSGLSVWPGTDVLVPPWRQECSHVFTQDTCLESVSECSLVIPGFELCKNKKRKKINRKKMYYMCNRLFNKCAG